MQQFDETGQSVEYLLILLLLKESKQFVSINESHI